MHTDLAVGDGGSTYMNEKSMGSVSGPCRSTFHQGGPLKLVSPDTCTIDISSSHNGYMIAMDGCRNVMDDCVIAVPRSIELCTADTQPPCTAAEPL